jgi:DNA-binding IclR family transcriptional regulator
MIKVLEKAFMTLDVIKRRGPDSLKNLSQATGVTKSTLYTILKSMVDLGFLIQDVGGRYGFSERLQGLTRTPDRQERLTELAREATAELGQALHENVTLVALENGRRRTLALHDGGRFVRVGPGEYEDNFYMFASGRIFLSHMEGPRLRAHFDLHGPPGARWPEVKDFRSFERAVARLRTQEVVTTHHDDTVGVAVPVAVPERDFLGALGVFLPKARCRSQRRKVFAKALRSGAERLRKRILEL